MHLKFRCSHLRCFYFRFGRIVFACVPMESRPQNMGIVVDISLIIFSGSGETCICLDAAILDFSTSGLDILYQLISNLAWVITLGKLPALPNLDRVR